MSDRLAEWEERSIRLGEYVARQYRDKVIAPCWYDGRRWYIKDGFDPDAVVEALKECINYIEPWFNVLVPNDPNGPKGPRIPTPYNRLWVMYHGYTGHLKRLAFYDPAADSEHPADPKH